MMDANGRLVIIDPVSFTAEDSPISKCDAIDPESLIAEIELLAAQQVIEKAKRRKAMRNPESTQRRVLKQRNKHKRFCKKLAKKHEVKQAEQARLNHLEFLKIQEEDRIAQRHFLNFGRAIHDEIFLEHNVKTMHKIFVERMNALNLADIECQLMDRPLHIDDIMQARLMG